jgi:hypothetical protein
MGFPIIPAALTALAGAALLLPRAKTIMTPGARTGPATPAGDDTGFQDMPQTKPNLPSFVKLKGGQDYNVEVLTANPLYGDVNVFLTSLTARLEEELFRQNQMTVHQKAIVGEPSQGQPLRLIYGVTFHGPTGTHTMKAPILSGAYIQSIKG